VVDGVTVHPQRAPEGVAVLHLIGEHLMDIVFFLFGAFVIIATAYFTGEPE